MEFPLSDFNLLDLERELYGHAMSTVGNRQQLQARLLTARNEKAEAQSQGFIRPGRPPILKFGAFVQPDDFAEIECMTDDEYEVFSKKVGWRLRRICRTDYHNGLEFYHPDALHRIDRSKTYSLNFKECWVRQKPYIHKLFLAFVSRTNGEEQRLCYARSFAKEQSQNMTSPLMHKEEIGRVFSNILLEIEDHGLDNYVAIIADKTEVNTKALAELALVGGRRLPPVIVDTYHLHASFGSMFSGQASHSLSEVQQQHFLKKSHQKQLKGFQSNCIQHHEADCLLKEYLKSLQQVLRGMWQIEEHRAKPIALDCLNNNRVNAYIGQLQNNLPPIPFEDCVAGAGLLQLLLFDTLWCLCDGHEVEEEYVPTTEHTQLAHEWMSILNS